MTARDGQSKGPAACESVQASGGSVEFVHLDLMDPARYSLALPSPKNALTIIISIANAARVVGEKFGAIDALINNAGFAFKGSTFGAAEAKQTLDINVRGTHGVTQAFEPLIKDDGVIINLCSMAGHLKILKSEALKQRFTAPDLTWDALDALCEEFVHTIGDGTFKESGWPKSMYGVSKLAEIALTKMDARRLAPRGIAVYAMCPGYVSTSMSSYKGTLTPEQVLLAAHVLVGARVCARVCLCVDAAYVCFHL
jgi:carbonyl reductase 1